MGRRNSKARSMLCVWAVVAGLPGMAAAFTPAEGTIDQNGTVITASGGPYLVSNPSGAAAGEPLCLGDGVSCDEFALTVDLSESFRQSNADRVLRVDVAIESASGADDLDLYVRDAQTGMLIGSSATSAGNETADIALSQLPAQVRVEVVPFAVAGGTSTLTIGFAEASGGEGGADPCAPTGEANGGAAQVDPEVDLAWRTLAPEAVFGALVHFNQGTHKQQDALLQSLGLLRTHDFRKYSRAVFVQGPVAAWLKLRTQPSVAWIEYNRPLRYLDATASWASRVRVAQEPVSGGPYYDAQGRILTGEGITLGVIDSGLYAPHPDFAGRVLHNYKLVQFVSPDLPQYVDVGESADTESQVGGHGTHVTGIIGGSGAASDGGYPLDDVAPNIRGTFTGAAPKAQLIHYAHGAGLFVLSALTAYEHILDHADEFDPPLRAVNNSYGDDAGTPYNPASAASCLIKAIVEEKHIVMAFAASNDGGDGSADMTSSYCKDPTPGVICVASYDDKGTGTLNGPLSSFSSRAKQGDASLYPDIAAPGDLITSTCAQAQPSQAICTGGDDLVVEDEWQPLYGTISGTSMATPHVVGAIGVILQAHPELTPAEIEALIQRSARKVGDGYEPDPQLSGNTVHFGYGAGLLDIKAALDELGVAHGELPPVGGEWTVFDGDEDLLTPDSAADIRSLTMQEVSEAGLPGIRYRIGLADAAGFVVADSVALRIEQNVGGVPAPTTVVLHADGSVTIPEAGPDNVAVAIQAALEGNVVSLFVPKSALGYPKVLEPVHNIRVVSATIPGDALGDADYAPSPSGVPALIAALQPMFGRAFTLQTAAGDPPPSDERSCTLPGLTVLTSPAGLTGTGLGLPAEDLRQGWVAEPRDMPGKIVFTLKTAGLETLPPLYRWYVYFTVPGSESRYFAAMDNLSGTPAFVYGTTSAIDTPAGGVGTFTVVGDLDPASGYTADGTITLVVDKATLGIETGMALSGLAASIRQTTNPVNGVGLTVDSAGAVGGYTVVGNDRCVAPDGASSSGQADTGRFGGALSPWLLLPLAAFAAWRRRRWLSVCRKAVGGV